MDLPLLSSDKFACYAESCGCRGTDDSPQNTPPSSAKVHMSRCPTLSSAPSSEKSAIFDEDALYASSVSSVQEPIEGPPSNFGVVEAGAVYRSAFPSPDTHAFLSRLQLKTILCLVEGAPDPRYAAWMAEKGIRFVQVAMPGKRETAAAGVPPATCARALEIVMDKRNHPLLIHCNHGKHRTGTVVACMRISHRWHRSRALDEYARFSHPKERKADISFINEFIAAVPA